MGDISLDYEIDPTTTPKHLTARMGRPPNEGIYTAIYELDGDNLKICYRERERPTGFETERGSMWTSHVLKRSKPDGLNLPPRSSVAQEWNSGLRAMT